MIDCPLCALLISTMRKVAKSVILRAKLFQEENFYDLSNNFYKIVNKNQDISVAKAHSLFLITMKKDRSM